ncbi:MAG: chromosomal replication initiator protein DnaA [Treponema sp.]|jgi:chromosomal replication initiator protein|nr:chromosomal replication initiator protein DnaA [Treponema sp.]
MADWDYEIFWKETLNLIQKEKDEQEFAMWFDLRYLKSTENEVIVTVPSSFYRDQVQSRYQDYLEAKVRELTGKDLAVVLEVRPRKTAPETVNLEEPEENFPKNTENTGKKHIAIPKERPPHQKLNRDYNFDKYVVGDNNKFAANAAMAITKNPGIAYNPFLIYGGVGLGKTHLMQAIGNYAHDNSNAKIIYVTAEDFTNEFIEHVGVITHVNKMAEFTRKYRSTDILLIDDIHLFGVNSTATLEELFHTFNALYNAKKQMVFTCDRPVSELKNLTERLKSRFSQGLTVDLLPPDYETRCAILHKKADFRGKNIPDEVIGLVSKNISTNVRDLEGAFNTLIAYAELVGRPITLEIARQQLKDAFASPKQTNISVDTIIRVVADYFSLAMNDIKGKKRSQNIVLPRQLAMYITREITEYSTTEVGQFFGGRDHTTVMYSCKQIEERIHADPTLDSTIQTLIRMIKEYNTKI